jgi:hypothetical protein
MTINNASIQLYNLASTEKKTLGSECNILSIVIKKFTFSKKWQVVGQTALVVGRRPNMPYSAYVTNLERKTSRSSTSAIFNYIKQHHHLLHLIHLKKISIQHITK